MIQAKEFDGRFIPFRGLKGTLICGDCGAMFEVKGRYIDYINGTCTHCGKLNECYLERVKRDEE